MSDTLTVPKADDTPTPPPARAARGWFVRQAQRMHPVGLALGLLFFVWSMSPSLLPRPWYLQSVATGIGVVTGYGLGCLIAWILRRCGVHPQWPAAWRRIGWWSLAAAAVVVIPTFVVLGSWWQQIVRELVGADQDARSQYILVVVLAFVVFVVLLSAGRGLRVATNRTSEFVGRFVPVVVARLAAVVVVVSVSVFLVNGVLYDFLLERANTSFAAADRGTAEGVVPPTAPEKSGSPESAQAWSSLGKEGRTFVASGPSAQEIGAFTGRPALEPVRAYAGRESAGTVEAIADNVVAELDRTGGFERDVLAVVTTTGRGWVNEDVATAFEYVNDGNTAIASMQYSFLPSPLAFIADRQTPMDAGRALFEAVYERWSELPVESRPRLVAFGESLGSYGGQSAFSGGQDMLARLDGALWVGTPGFTEQWRYITDHRDAGSYQRLPVVDEGRDIRFAADPADLELPGPWDDRRIVFWQHASDPITWWGFDLLLERPDWLREPLGADVDPGMSWIPFVTFWQVTLDMVFSADVPSGHGHNYGADAVDLWAQILQPEQWTAADTERLRVVLGG
ncbi:hypothetical protein G4H71_09885 [Rhodococcus triatomae]|nr:hypothetical protein G4H72_20500 [Rhodococcus triatomae]QNG23303.1 hypothetical protein G4H71_09885 [Rhodococcus triatomae]